jgi:hypothetical protein
LSALVLFLGDPRKLIMLPVVPFVAVVLALKIYVNYSLDDVHAFYLSFLAVAGFCSLLGMVHVRRPALAKAVALVAGIVNALLIPALARYFA